MKTKEEILESCLKEQGIRKGWIPESKKAVLDAMKEHAKQHLDSVIKRLESLKRFDIINLTNEEFIEHERVEAIDGKYIDADDIRVLINELKEKT